MITVIVGVIEHLLRTKYGSKCFTLMVSFNPHRQPVYEIGAIIIPVLWMRRLRLRECE